jgi:hypothetical protein
MMVDLANVVIFDPNTASLYDAKGLVMTMNGNALQLTLPRTDGGDPFTPIAPVTDQPKRSRSRSARAADKKLSRAFKEANARYRKKDGSLRAGRTQADIARLAHKLRKMM